ncbi:MAG: NlpC/P60 family protein [Bacteroidota bacterium]|nr:NlpC/P60 family protein [Bacteroidota bacterium]MDP4229356.1 NlpC/P60 family protein [Bacteroidota bacterium]MDP4236350.1 NlpC/P60 family protein [Bacteroidota bacterium]
MLKRNMRRGWVLVGLVMLGFLLTASSPSDSQARHHRGGKAVKKTTSHSASHKRHAKFSSRKHRTPQRPLTASEKSEIIGKIKSLASAEVLPEQGSPAADNFSEMQPADVAQAAKEEREEDDVEVSIDRFFKDRSIDVSAEDPETARSRQTDFTLFDESDPKVTSTRSDVMQHIIDWVGTRYHFGGLTRSGIDCSAFTREVFRTSFNVDLPRTASMQSVLGSSVHKDELKFGDLVFFHTAGYAKVSHVGIYVGEGLFANASCSRGVTVSSLDSKYWAKRFLFAKRLFTNTATAQKEVMNSMKLAIAAGELAEDNTSAN